MTDFISDDELLARYITSSRWYRKSDQTVKPDAFVPPEDPLELSTTRHLNLSEDRIWDIGQKIATGQSRNLHGRADIKVLHVILQSLSVVSDPTLCNPNHANIIKWPDKKNARKLLALELAKNACFLANPDQ
ncbi:MAG: hypothetical protein OXC97_00255 [Candidatus Dadabacteria bacterium]|nr:hypothetical protein [Candidatus Dadabacteria bacterium]